MNGYERIKALRMDSENNMLSMKQRLDSFNDFFCNSGLPEDYFEQIAPLLSLLPDSATEGCILETCLDKDEFLPDFSVHFRKPVCFPGQLPENRIWHNISSFMEEWQKNEELKDIINFWLEFDMDKGIHGIPVPAVFIKIDLPVFGSWLTNPVLKLLNGEELIVRVEENLKKCFYFLPRGAIVSQLGLMHSRASKSIRAYIRNIDIKDLPSYLEKIEYAGDILFVESTLEKYTSGISRVNIQLDIGEDIPEQIAFEYKPLYPGHISTLLDTLHKKGLCTNLKRALVNGWYREEKLSSLGFPVLVTKYISHIKLVLYGDEAVKAKAYLGVYYT